MQDIQTFTAICEKASQAGYAAVETARVVPIGRWTGNIFVLWCH